MNRRNALTLLGLPLLAGCTDTRVDIPLQSSPQRSFNWRRKPLYHAVMNGVGQLAARNMIDAGLVNDVIQNSDAAAMLVWEIRKRYEQETGKPADHASLRDIMDWILANPAIIIAIINMIVALVSSPADFDQPQH